MSRPNILFLLSDEHSFRFLGALPRHAGGEPVSTPTLDRLIAAGTYFTDAYCQMPLCTPSRLCMLTGREVRAAGAWHNGSVIRPEVATLPGTLADAGYETCLVGKMHLGGSRQFAGFHHRPYGDLTGETGHQWEPLADEARHSMRYRTSRAGVTEIPESLIQDEVVAHETVSFVREHEAAQPDRPWFVCASFSRPHFPITAPKRCVDRYRRQGITRPYVPATGDAFNHPMSVGMRRGFQAAEVDDDEMMSARRAYFAAVTYLDEVIGDLLLRLEADGSLENTVIVYTTDHGELAGEHGVWWKNGWYEGCTRVPLIVSLPEDRRGGRGRLESTPVGLIDLFPTLCSLASAEQPDGLDGVDLSPALFGSAAPDRPVVCDVLNPRWGDGMEFRMVRHGRFKYVGFRDAPPLLFDLDSDPLEQRNLIGASGAAGEAQERLSAYVRETMDFDEAERERTERDGPLRETYAHDLPSLTAGNAYTLPDGRVISADEIIYDPRVLAESVHAAFSDAPHG